jgi:hypothetical protein
MKGKSLLQKQALGGVYRGTAQTLAKRAAMKKRPTTTHLDNDVKGHKNLAFC